IRKPGPRHIQRTGLDGSGCFGAQEHRRVGESQPAIPRRALQSTEPRELWFAKSDGLHEHWVGGGSGLLHQSHGGPDHDPGDNASADPVRPEVDVLRWHRPSAYACGDLLLQLTQTIYTI